MIQQRRYHGRVAVHGRRGARHTIRDTHPVADHAAGIIDGPGAHRQDIVRVPGPGIDIVYLPIPARFHQHSACVLSVWQGRGGKHQGMRQAARLPEQFLHTFPRDLIGVFIRHHKDPMIILENVRHLFNGVI